MDVKGRLLVPLALAGVIAGVIAVVIAVTATPAGATVSPQCKASGTFSKGGTVDAAQASAKIPNKDTVAWRGSIKVPKKKDMPYSGEIKVKAPPPFGEFTFDSWSGTTDKVANNGNRTYDFSGSPPFKATVSGFHTQSGVTCRGSMEIEVGGSLGAIGLAALGLTVLSGAGVVFSALAKVGR